MCVEIIISGKEKANVDLNKCGLQINRCKYASYKILKTTIRPNKSVDDVEIVVVASKKWSGDKNDQTLDGSVIL